MRGKEQHRSLDWIMFLSADKKTIEYMFLTELTLCFDGHEAVEVKAINKTFTSPNFFGARKSARAAMEEHMGKKYGPDYVYTSPAYHRHGDPTLIKNYPAWF